MKTLTMALAATLVAAAAFAQTPAAGPRFEVVSIKPSTSFAQAVADGSLIGQRLEADRVFIGHADLAHLLLMAYGINRDQLQGPAGVLAPPDPSAPLLDIEAVMPKGATAADVPAMLRAMLVERFKLVAHTTHARSETYALVVAPGGITFRRKDPAAAAPAAPAGQDQAGLELGAARISARGSGTLTIDASTLQGLVDALANQLRRPVVDKTGLTGAFDIHLEISPDFAAVAQSGGSPDAMRVAMADGARRGLETLGLQVQSQQNDVEIVVVDSIQQTPTPN